MSFSAGQMIAQVRPGTAGVFNPLAEGSSRVRREIFRVFVTNTTTSPHTFSICHDRDGSSHDEESALWWEYSIGANETFEWVAPAPGCGIPLGTQGEIAFSSSAGDALTCSVYGASAPVKAEEI